ncbi:MAG TPA: hypothetical protein VGN97_14525 [Mesorhizobium sp.]|jgi:hypothetical protein|nr:hypothetical protein [Mesorhizobium sp.]
MLVFGDAERLEAPGEMVRSIREALASAEALPPGLSRHAALAAAFVQAGELVQALADREFELFGFDALSPAQSAGARLLLALAQALDRSWTSGFSAGVPLASELPSLLDTLSGGEPVRAKHAEGFSIYALYPETYLAAARASGLGPGTTVIGIRSIGSALGALVAAALGAKPAWSVRPVGHPFARELRVAPKLAASIPEGSENKPFAVVDEGPGLSGSSFAAVDAWLQAQGVAPERIHFFPSHAGEPGPQAGPERRERWRAAPRHHTSFEQVILEAETPAHRLETWATGLLGDLDAPLQDISGGAWRELDPLPFMEEGGRRRRWRGPAPNYDAPPADAPMERRKFLARRSGETFLLKFAGLGAEGFRKLHHARLLAAAKLAPEPVGLVNGFLVERWIEAPALAQTQLGRKDLVAGLARYIAVRARLLPAFNRGASLPDLFAMTRHNVAQALGEEAAAALEARLAPLAALEEHVRPVGTDNRLHGWEWRVLPDGRLLKHDALDHAAAHDLVGCQDISWDVAGAIVEHALSPDETEVLRGGMTAAGVAVRQELVEALFPCYLAFQLGLWTMAAGRAAPGESERLQSLANDYGERLSLWLQS